MIYYGLGLQKVHWRIFKCAQSPQALNPRVEIWSYILFLPRKSPMGYGFFRLNYLPFWVDYLPWRTFPTWYIYIMFFFTFFSSSFSLLFLNFFSSSFSLLFLNSSIWNLLYQVEVFSYMLYIYNVCFTYFSSSFSLLFLHSSNANLRCQVESQGVNPLVCLKRAGIHLCLYRSLEWY